jgi:hypothetical protein
MTRLVLTLSLLGLVSAQAQTYLPRSELMKPLSEAVEKSLAEFVERCAVEKLKQLTTHMAEVLKAVDAAAKLTADETAAMLDPTKKAVASAVAAWKQPGVVAMRTYLSRTSDAAATRHINGWKPDLAGLNEPVEGWTPPEQDAGIGGQHLHGLALHAVAECHCPARRLHRASTFTGAARSRQLSQLMEQPAHGTTSSWNNQNKKEAGQNNFSNKNNISFETIS